MAKHTLLFLLRITVDSISLPTSTAILAYIMAVKCAMSSKKNLFACFFQPG